MTSGSNFESKYKSGKSVAKNQDLPIHVDDPRLLWNKYTLTKARQGSQLDIIGIEGKNLITGGSSLITPNPNGVQDSNAVIPSIIIPPMDGQPPKTYPGGSGPQIITPTNPYDVIASWSGEDLVINFNWDYSNELNSTISQFIVELTADGVTKRTPLNTFIPNKTQTAQTVTVTKLINTGMFGILRTALTSICVLTADPLNNISQSICATSLPTYVLDLPVPTITVTAINNGYSVSYTTPTQSSFNSIDIVEYESTSTTEPTGVTYSRSYFGSLNPANIIVSNLNARWVKARFTSDGGNYTAYSTAYKVTPTSSVGVDNTPPNEVSQIQASWSGDNIIVDYKLPAQDAGSRVQIELTSPNSLVGYFYRFPDGSGRDQTTTITKKDLFDQFGAHYSSFSGILRSIDPSDNRSAGVSFTVAARTNLLSGVTPTFTLTPLTNGYSVFATNYATTTGVSYMEVYAKHTAWVGNPTDDTYVVYAGANPAVVIDTDHTTVYVKIHYYDDFGNTSLYSAEDTVVPMGPGEITSFETPISFGTNGVIYAGGDYASGKRTVFKSSGIFAYDATNTTPSTQIISDASAGTPTFITTQANIADWNITSTKIENTLSGTPTKYTGLSATGTYAFWAGSDTSGGDSSAKFTVTPLGAVTARELYIVGTGDANSNLISAGGLFTVKHDGTFTATGANITGTLYATGGEFTGNVKLNGGSLYALGSGGTVSSGIRTIFNSSGIAAYNASGGYAEMLTTPLADGSVFATTAANIGGWTVDQNRIYKTSISGKGNIEIDSTNGYISVSHSSISDSKAGINSPSNNINDNVFWAGSFGPTSTSNPFRVTLGGKLFATGADITGTVSSIGALGTMSMDGTHGYMSLKTAGTNAPVSYLVPRNNNIYLTAPSTTEPWSTGTEIASSGPTNAPYFSAGSSFKDYWNNTSIKGVGMYTGPWDYFSTGSSKPFITASTTGIQLSVSPDLGLLLDGGTATGTNLNPAVDNGIPSMVFYTAKNATAPYSPTTAYGAWAAFTNSKITMAATSSTLIRIDGTQGSSRIDLKATTDIYQTLTSTGIRLQSSNTVYQEFKTDGTIEINSGQIRTPSDLGAYESSSKILVDTDGIGIFGVPRASTFDMTDYRAYDKNGNYLGGSGKYRDADPLGYPPRQRMVIEDPVSGRAELGMAVYYMDTNKINVTVKPDDSMGVQGDLAVWFS